MFACVGMCGYMLIYVGIGWYRMVCVGIDAARCWYMPQYIGICFRMLVYALSVFVSKTLLDKESIRPETSISTIN